MRKITNFILGFIILGFLSSCKTQYSTTELNANFNSQEIQDLNKIRDFFKVEMCIYRDLNFKDCYKEIPHDYLDASGNPFWTNIDFEKQQKLYNEISISTFEQIWTFCKTKYRIKPGLEFKTICANSEGKYQKYLSELGKKNPRIAEYSNVVNSSGHYDSIDLQYWEIKKNKKYINLNDPNIQLILAIHYLSLNDQEKRDEKWVD
ncbi:hypothetical protein [Flavobacterium gelidilacus]|uniref:hypothetical protein n=1 Tax=Flavobacterium gelidilacus TaxID=206041 RepID=UPI0006864F01|nr:hypothetical protein [Flavobacterium gelidilacus]